MLHLSTYTSGGAGRAALRLHNAMRYLGVDSTIHSGSGTRFRIAGELERRLSYLQGTSWLTWRSIGRFASDQAQRINASPADIVNLHWVTGGFLSVEEIAAIDKPVVWTMHDMWTFTGTEHYAPETPEPTRWQEGYAPSNRVPGESGPDLERWTWERKRKQWTTPMHLVPVSNWLAEATLKSSFGSWPITVVPNVMDTTTFAAGSREQARSAMKLPETPLIAFTSSSGISDERKGWHLLQEALPHVKKTFPDATVMVIGQGDPAQQSKVAENTIWMGQVDDEATMAQLLQAADVIAVPSTADNLPMTACEAQCVGRAVVAFNAGGLADTVDHLSTGYLAQPFDITEYGQGLVMAIEDSRGRNHWGANARERAEQLWSPQHVVDQYLKVYEQVLR